MLGAIVGDVIGSTYESLSQKTKDFELFNAWSQCTDDSVMTIAVAHALETGRPWAEVLREVGVEYPTAGYGGHFIRWLHDPSEGPYNSWGNGSAMRVSPVGWAFDTEAEVLAASEAQAAVSHNHPEGIKGAQAVALAVFLARKGASKAEIARRVTEQTGYDLNRRLDDLRPTYDFYVDCQRSVPEALIAFLESTDFDDALRNAISLGGDADTQACIAGAVAEAFYGGVPAATAEFALGRVTPWLLDRTVPFLQRFGLPSSASQARTRWMEVYALVSSPSEVVLAPLPFSDAVQVVFPGPALFPKGSVTMTRLTDLVRAGWTRLLLDTRAVARISEAEWTKLEFLRKSCRVRRGLVALVGTPPREMFDVFADLESARPVVEASRGKGRMVF